MTYKFYDGNSGNSIEIYARHESNELSFSIEERGGLSDFIIVELDASEIDNMISAIQAIKKELDERV